MSSSRRAWRIFAQALSLALLSSLLFATPALAERTVTITGGGWGHGIGMSQYGAYGRARNGKSATQILERYYQGARVTSAKMPKLRVGLLPSYGGSALRSISFDSVAGPGGGTGRLVVRAGGQAVAEGVAGDKWRAEAAASGAFRIYKNGEQVRTADGVGLIGGSSTPLILKYQGSKSMIGVTGKSHRYRHGDAEISSYPSTSCDGGMCARIVLRIGMQKYLYGLGEVPSSWPQATLQAQAIAGRTYAYEKVVRSGQNRYPCGCAVHDTVIDQAYIGDSKRTGSGQYWAAWRASVVDTKDRIVTYEGQPIQALYSSSSGGHTENNDLVWGGAPIAYLRGVRDGPDRAGGANPNFKWTTTMSWSSFESKLNSAYGIGTLKDFQLLQPFGVSGRVTVPNTTNGTGGVRIVGSNKTVHVSGWSIRGALGLRDSLFRVDLGVEVAEPFRARYAALDGAPGPPTSGAYRVPRGNPTKRGVAQNFEVGRMTRHWGLGRVVWQYGPILKKYNSLGRESSSLGLPRTDIWGTTRRGAKYDKGRILWSKATRARALVGPFEKAFVRAGGANGALGLPTSNRSVIAEWPEGGRRQRFQDGTIYGPPGNSEAFALWGEVDARYRNMDEASGRCGYPTADAQETDGSLIATFQNGTIVRGADGEVEVRCSG